MNSANSSTFSWAWAAPLLCVLLLAALAAYFSLREQQKMRRLEEKPSLASQKTVVTRVMPVAAKTHHTTFYFRLRNGWLVEATVEVPPGVTIPSKTVRKLVEAATYTAPIEMSAAEMAENIFEDQGYKLVKFLVRGQEPDIAVKYATRATEVAPLLEQQLPASPRAD